mgnify:FL=1
MGKIGLGGKKPEMPSAGGFGNSLMDAGKKAALAEAKGQAKGALGQDGEDGEEGEGGEGEGGEGEDGEEQDP